MHRSPDTAGRRPRDLAGVLSRRARQGLGWTEIDEDGLSAFGPHDAEDLILSEGGPLRPSIHLAFAAASVAEMERFHRCGLEAGGTDNGAPGPRPKYSAGYHGAFLIDPDGHNVEAVFHAPSDRLE